MTHYGVKWLINTMSTLLEEWERKL
jgi:hypothetical protein